MHYSTGALLLAISIVLDFNEKARQKIYRPIFFANRVFSNLVQV